MIRIVTSITLASGGSRRRRSVGMGVAAADPDATTISVPDPFGVSFVGNPDLTYQTGDASENIAYGYQTIDFDSSNFSSVFTSNVTVDGQPLNLSTNPLIANDLQADMIDKLQSNGEAQQSAYRFRLAGQRY